MNEPRWEQIGQRMADALTEKYNVDKAVAEARSRVLGTGRKRSRELAFWALAGAAIAVVAVQAASWVRKPPSAISFTIGDSRAPGATGQFLGAVDSPVELAFSEGTRIVIEAPGRARVLALAPKGADLVVERGTIQAQIKHQPDSRWLLHAGPIDVAVTGTRFEMDWDPDKGTFRLALHEGRLTVRGCSFGQGLVVEPGQSVQGQCQPPVAAFAAPAASSEPSALPANSEAPKTAESLASAAASGHASSPTWQSFAQSREYSQALKEAEAQGFESVCQTASAQDLMVLADVARYAKNGGRANQALTAVRARFPGTAQASAAAFTLGTIAFDSRGDTSGAATWFERYLAESPQGPFAREARGRLMESLARMGNRERAQRAAHEYLAAYPRGPHAALAQRILDEK